MKGLQSTQERLWKNPSLLVSIVAVVISIASCGITLQQTQIARLGVQAKPEVTEAFNERTTRSLGDDGPLVIRCRSYLFVANDGGQDTSIVNAHLASRIRSPSGSSTRVTAADLDISEPIGVGFWTSNDLDASGFLAVHIYETGATSTASALEQTISAALADDRVRLTEAGEEGEYALRAAAQAVFLRLLASSAFDQDLPASLPLGLPSGSVTRIIVESIFFPLQATPAAFRDVDIAQDLVLGLSSTPPIHYTSSCEDSNRLDRVDLGQAP